MEHQPAVAQPSPWDSVHACPMNEVLPATLGDTRPPTCMVSSARMGRCGDWVGGHFVDNFDAAVHVGALFNTAHHTQLGWQEILGPKCDPRYCWDGIF